MLHIVTAPLCLAFIAGFLVQRIACKEAEFAALKRIESTVDELRDKADGTSEKLRTASEKTSEIDKQVQSMLESQDQLKNRLMRTTSP